MTAAAITSAFLRELGPRAERRHPLGELTTLGRDPGNAIVLDDPAASRHHACVRREAGDTFVVEDMGSRFGTFVGGRRVQQETLCHGSELTIGASRLVFEVEVAAPVLAAPPVRDDARGLSVRFETRGAVSFPALQGDAADAAMRANYQKLRAAFELARAIGPAMRLDEVLARIVDASLEIFGADAAGIALFGEGGEVEQQLSRRRDGRSQEVTLSSSVLRELRESGETVVALDLREDERFRDAPSILAGGLRSIVSSPMLHGDEVIGALQLEMLTTPRTFAAGDAELVAFVAAQAALSVANVRLARRLRDAELEGWRRLERLVQDLPVGLVLLGPDRRVSLVNPLGERHLQQLAPDCIGQPLSHLGDGSLEQILSVPSGETLEVTAGPPDASRVFRVVPAVVEAGGSILVLHDVTARRERETQLMREERLALVGRLAGGIAHDVNNVLAVVAGYAEALAIEATNPTHREDATTILDEAMRGARITRQLLNFSRREASAPELLSLNDAIRDTEKLMSRAAGQKVALEVRYSEPSAMVLADPARIEQMLLNLVVNARDAMPDGGTLFVSTQLLQVGSSGGAEEDGPAVVGDHVELCVRDTGTGIAPAILARIFEPFFSTKAPGRGTGLGLATVRGIVDALQGTIAVDSQLGRGTELRIYLPDRRASAPALPRSPIFAPSAPRGGSETVLVADDHPLLLANLRRSLAGAGYDVVTAVDLDEALAVWEECRVKPSLLVADLQLSRGSGPAIATVLRARAPGLAVLLLAANPDDPLLDPREGALPWSVLMKPFRSETLVARVRELIDGAAF